MVEDLVHIHTWFCTPLLLVLTLSTFSPYEDIKKYVSLVSNRFELMAIAAAKLKNAKRASRKVEKLSLLIIYRRYFQHAHFIPKVGVGKRGEY